MHVLMIPSWYPSPAAPLAGIFFAEQATKMSEAGVRMGVVHAETRSLRRLSPFAIAENHWQIQVQPDVDPVTMRLAGWNTGTARSRAFVFRVGVRALTRRYVASFGCPDLIHAQATLWGGVAAADESHRLGIPYVITEHASSFRHDSLPIWQREAAQLALGKASAVMAVSEYLSREVTKIAPAARVRVIPNIADVDFFSLSPVRGSTERYTFLAVGRLIATKAYDVLIRAFDAAFHGHPAVVLRIVGAGPDRSALAREIERHHLVDRITLVGELSREMLRNEMWRADAFVHPSLRETFGLVIAEAQATGLPTIATRCGGPEEIVREGTGVLVAPGDTDELARALSAMYVTRDEWSMRGARIRSSIEYRYAARNVVEQLLDVYRSVLHAAP